MEFLKDLLEKHNGNITKTAEAIGMTREGLSKKLKRLGITGKQ
jgi:DNA-binding NtrC family response regulator